MKIPRCHFTYMEYRYADTGDGCIESWYECHHCGHTLAIARETVSA